MTSCDGLNNNKKSTIHFLNKIGPWGRVGFTFNGCDVSGVIKQYSLIAHAG